MNIENLKFDVDFVEFDVDEYWGVRILCNDGSVERDTPVMYVPKLSKDEKPNKDNIFKMLRFLLGPGKMQSIMSIPEKLNSTFGKKVANILLGYEVEKETMSEQEFYDIAENSGEIEEYDLPE